MGATVFLLGEELGKEESMRRRSAEDKWAYEGD